MSLRAPNNLYQQQASVLVTAPTVEPVGVPEMRQHLAIAHSEDDLLLESMLLEAREEIERQSGMALINQTWRLSLDRWPTKSSDEWWDGVRQGALSMLYGDNAPLELPVWPLVSITSVTVYDTAGNDTAVSVGGTFDVDTYSRPGRLALKAGQTWPVALRPTNAIQVLYVAGYGSTGNLVPAPLRRAIRQMTSWLYAHRGDDCEPTDAYRKSGAAEIVGRYKVQRL